MPLLLGLSLVHWSLPAEYVPRHSASLGVPESQVG